MPDITKCLGEGCQKKYSCYRYLAEASKFQSYDQAMYESYFSSYFIKTPIIDGKCEYYINHNMLPRNESK